MARKGISMEINAISTLLFAVIVLGILGYYLIQYVINKTNQARCKIMKRFLQLIIGALVVGMLCLTLSHWFKSKEQVHTNQKIYVYNWANILIQS